jgi:hypothetical protein
VTATRLAERRPRLEHKSGRRRAHAAPTLSPLHAHLIRLQQTAGNRAVARQVESATATVAAAGPADDAKKLAETAPSTNVELAEWILKADAQGFVSWEFSETATQMKTLSEGKKVGSVDPTRAAIFDGLRIAHDLVKGAVDRWIPKPAEPKPTVTLGSFIRSSGGHATGEMIDINDLRFTGAEGPDDVLTALGSLQAGSYGIGLPFQGEFFPAELELSAREKAEEASATAEKRDPAPITEALTLDTTRVSSAAYDKAKKEWVVTKGVKPEAESHLKSDELKKGLGELRTKGYSIYVFPDRPNHIHIQNG